MVLRNSRNLEYQYMIIPTGFKEDKWVQMAEARPTNRPMVHHIIAYVREPIMIDRTGVTPERRGAPLSRYA